MLLSGGLAFTPRVYGQFDDFDSLISRYVLSVDTSGLVFFKPEEFAPGEPYAMYQLYSGDTLHTLNLLRTWTDSILHMDHYLYQEHYRQVPIEAAFYTEHAAAGYLVFANGKYTLFDPDENAEPLLDDSTALGILLDSLDGHEFAWLNQEWEDDLKVDTGDSTATYYPVGTLLWVLTDYKDLLAHIPDYRYRLAWEFEILSLDSSFHKAFYVDANTGTIFRVDQLECDDGPANILMQGTQTIDTRWQSGSPSGHILWTDNNNRNVHTKYYVEPRFSNSSWRRRPEIRDDDDDWGNNEQYGTTAHWMVSRSWDFFASSPYSRNGLDGAGKEIRVDADAQNYENARYLKIGKSDYLQFGFFGGNYLAVIDVAGHEYTHGIIQHTAKLRYRDEPGGLNESFADIFGFMVERFSEDSVKWDWLIGEDAPTHPEPDHPRSLEDPNSEGLHFTWNNDCHLVASGQPDTYKGDFWYFEKCDEGGVHVNSGVQNYWFYLLAAGGAGVNDNNDAYDISGIGIDKAALITWYSLTNILQRGAQYADSRAGAIAAATLLFPGHCRNEVVQTTNAWSAVGVGEASSCVVSNLNTARSGTIIRLYPNPAGESAKLSFSNAQTRRVQLCHIDGRLIRSFGASREREITLDTCGLSPGLYLLRIQESGAVHTLKLIKR